MTTSLPSKENTDATLETKRSESFLKIYTNNAQVELSIWDCRLIFGEMEKTGDKAVVEQLVSVVMSIQHMKALAGVLVSNLQEYEKRFGEIKLVQQENKQQTEEPKTRNK